jgi:hypothetical protein
MLLVPLAAGVHLLAARAPQAVERWFAGSLYPGVAAGLSALSGLVRFSAAEWLAGAVLLGTPAGGIALFVLSRRGGAGWLRAVAAVLGLWLALAGGLYLAFLLSWGLNHQRPPLAKLIGLDSEPGGVEELRRLCEELAAEADAAREGLPEDAAGVMRLEGGLEAAMQRAGRGFRAPELAELPFAAAAARAAPKLPLVSPLLWRAGISGIYVPFTGEAHVNATLPHPDVPFAACHELAHLAGFAREDEASYVGYRACRAHPDPDFRYSALFAASLYAAAALARVDREQYEEVSAVRSPAVRRDVEAVWTWSRRYQGAVRRTAERVNDGYLKSQGHALGIRSYGRMVDLMLAERRRARP